MNIKQSWSYQHKHLIITLSLATALTVIAIEPRIPRLEASDTYTATKLDMAATVEQRAHEIEQERKPMMLEVYRQEAIQELGHELLNIASTSPFVDYAELKEKYGY